MSLKMMKSRLLVSALFAVSSLAAVACGDSKDDGKDDKDATVEETPVDPEDDGGVEVPATHSRMGTLVGVTAQDTSAPIKTPHKIVVVDNMTGEPIVPRLEVTTSATDGTWKLDNIPGTPVAFHTAGVGTETYDAVTINITANTAPDPLSRISAAGTAMLAAAAGGYTAASDKAGLSVGLYHVVNKVRMGVIGCAQLKVTSGGNDITSTVDVRYVNAMGLPQPNSAQQKSERTRGATLIANLPKGKHTLEFSVDGGTTWIGKTDIYINKTRDEALGPTKNILYLLGVEYATNVTPSSCT